MKPPDGESGGIALEELCKVQSASARHFRSPQQPDMATHKLQVNSLNFCALSVEDLGRGKIGESQDAGSERPSFRNYVEIGQALRK